MAVDRFYQGMEQIEQVAQDLKSVRIGTLRIVAIRTLGSNFLSEGIRRFSLARPGVIISLDVRSSLDVLQLAALIRWISVSPGIWIQSILARMSSHTQAFPLSASFRAATYWHARRPYTSPIARISGLFP
jgi:DNA-binding transcriptional LysR family regulator